ERRVAGALEDGAEDDVAEIAVDRGDAGQGVRWRAGGHADERGPRLGRAVEVAGPDPLVERAVAGQARGVTEQVGDRDGRRQRGQPAGGAVVEREAAGVEETHGDQ